MATHAHSIGAPVAATQIAALHALPAPANDTLRPWTADPRAVKLLASCAALPPINAEQRSRYGNAVDHWTAYVGYRVEALESIRMEAGDKLLAAYHQHGEVAYPAFRDWCEQPNASDAVAAVLASKTEA